MGHNVYRATDYDILPLNPDVAVSNPPNPVEAHLLALVRSHLYGGYFLYSYGWDLSRRLQAQWETIQEDAGRALWEVVSVPQLPSASSSHWTVGRRQVLLEQVRVPNMWSSCDIDHNGYRFLQSRFIDVTHSNTDQNVRASPHEFALSCIDTFGSS